MASLIETAPWVVALERQRTLLFSVSGALLALNYWMVVVRPRRCAPGELCHMDTPFMRFNRRLYWLSVVMFAVALVITYGSAAVFASGHGPLFGAATPTLGKGGWQFDQAWLGRMVEGPGTDEQTLRTMISFGITEDLQISGSVPIVLDSSGLMP